MAVAVSLPSGDSSVGAQPDFERIYEQHLRFVWRILVAVGVPESRLEDAAQDVFVAVHAKLSAFEGRSKLTTWLYGIARNVALEYVRRAARERRRARELVEIAAEEVADSNPEEAARAAQSRRLLLEILDRLESGRREVFVLVELGEIPVREVAAMLELNENTVWSRLRLARGEFERHAARLRARSEDGSP